MPNQYTLAHQFINTLPVHTRTIYALGLITQNWMFLEQTIEMLLWKYLKLAPKLGPGLTTHMANNLRLEALRNLVEKIERNPKMKQHIAHGLKCWEILQDNRNSIVHSKMSIKGEKIIFTKIQARKGIKTTRIIRKTDALLRVADNISTVGEFLQQLYYQPSGLQRPLPRKPALPRKLRSNPRQRKKRKFPPRSSRA